MTNNNCNNYCKIINTEKDTITTFQSCTNSDEDSFIDPKILREKKKCLYKGSNNIQLEINPSPIFVPNSSNCWGNSDRMGSSTNNIGIIDKDKNNNYVKKCCVINNIIVPHSDVSGNKVFVGKCKIISDDGQLKDDTNAPHILTTSHICKINNDKPDSIDNSSETTQFCKIYNCCSNINMSDN
tara:strand:+ start:695 stop:1243 length:549 start_codon:yes stop_codon:yes gene_type:complete